MNLIWILTSLYNNRHRLEITMKFKYLKYFHPLLVLIYKFDSSLLTLILLIKKMVTRKLEHLNINWITKLLTVINGDLMTSSHNLKNDAWFVTFLNFIYLQEICSLGPISHNINPAISESSSLIEANVSYKPCLK